MKTATPANPNDHISTQKQKVVLLAQANQLTEARELARNLSKTIPRDPEIWFLLGAIHGELSEYSEAERCCRKALSSAPEHPVLNFNMGVALRGQEKTAEAIPFLKTAIQLQPDYVAALHELANTLCLEKQYTPALELYEQAIKLAPDSPVIHRNTGDVLQELGRFDRAIHHYELSLSLEPDSSSTLYGLASALIATYKYAKAINMLEAALQRLPDATDLYFKLAVAYQEQGDSGTALEYYKKVLALDENNLDAKVGMASILGLQGNYKEAGTRLLRLIDGHPENIAAILAYSHFAHHLGETEKAIELVNNALSDKRHADLTRSKLEFSLGELFDRSGNPESAFQHYDTGNKLHDNKFRFDSFKRYFFSIMDAVSEATIKTLPRADYTSSITPVFIVGMPRSGTTLVEQILASHDKVTGAGELPYINNIVDNLSESINSKLPYPACLADLDRSSSNRLARTYLDLLTEKSSGATFITDKLPSNFIHLGLISILLPGAKIIHCVRDARDTCLSCYFKDFSGAHFYAYNLEDLGKYYQLYQQLMQHWNNTLQVPIHEISYEKLVLNQKEETVRLLEFCGLDWDDACLNFHKTSRTVSTASHDQVRQPLYSKSIDRWKQFEQHLGPLIKSLETDN